MPALTIINDETRRLIIKDPHDFLDVMTSSKSSNLLLPPSTESSTSKQLPSEELRPYVVKSSSACFLCDMKPSPTSQHVAGNDESQNSTTHSNSNTVCEVFEGCEGENVAEQLASAQSKTSTLALPKLPRGGGGGPLQSVFLLRRAVILYCE